MKTSNNTVQKLEENQAQRILAVLEAAGVDFMVERTPDGWRVETEQQGIVEGLSCTATTLAEALGQVTTVLGVALELDQEDEIPDERIAYTLDEPVEYCKRFTVKRYEYQESIDTELGFSLAQIAE